VKPGQLKIHDSAVIREINVQKRHQLPLPRTNHTNLLFHPPCPFATEPGLEGANAHARRCGPSNVSPYHHTRPYRRF